MKKTISVVFCLFIAAMGVLTAVMPKSDYSPTEKRYLATFPDISFSGIADGSFSVAFEKYLADHLPFRKAFVTLNSYFEYFKGNNGSGGVYLGKNGTLIEKPVNDFANFQKNCFAAQEFFAESGKNVFLCLVPEKGYVLNGLLPKSHLSYNDDEYLDFASELGGIRFIDLRNALGSADDFYRTDHHWSSIGAYRGYKAICASLGLNPADISKYTVENTEGFYGTSYGKGCYTFVEPEAISVMKNFETKGKARVTITDGGKSTEYDNMFFDEALETDDKYTVFLNGNHALVTIETGNEGGTLLLIKDSFAHCLTPFLAENYSEIIMADLRYLNGPISSLIDEETDDIIILYGLSTFAESKDIILY